MTPPVYYDVTSFLTLSAGWNKLVTVKMIPSLLIMLLLTKQNILNQKWLFILWVKNNILAKKSSFDLRNRLGFAFQIKGLRPIMARRDWVPTYCIKWGFMATSTWRSGTLRPIYFIDETDRSLVRPMSHETTSSSLKIPESDYTLRIFRNTNKPYFSTLA